MTASSSPTRLHELARQIVAEPRRWLTEVSVDGVQWLKDAIRSDVVVRQRLADFREGDVLAAGEANPDVGFVTGALLFLAQGGGDVETGLSTLECPPRDIRLLPIRIETADALLELPDVRNCPEDAAFVLTHRGNSFAQLPFGSRGENQAYAIASFSEAVRLARQSGDHSLQAALLNNLGNVTKEQPGADWEAHRTAAVGHYQDSLQELEAALECGQIGADEYAARFASVTSNLANALRDRSPEGSSESTSSVERSLALFRRVLLARQQPTPERAETLRNMAIAVLKSTASDRASRTHEALTLLDEARSIYDSLGLEFWSAVTLLNMGSALMRQVEVGFHSRSLPDAVASRLISGSSAAATAREYFQRAARVFERLGHRREWTSALKNLGVLERQAGHVEAAAQCFQQAALLVEAERSESTSMLARRDWLVQFVDILEGAAVSAIAGNDQDDPESVSPFEWLDRCVGRTLDEWIGRRQLDQPLEPSRFIAGQPNRASRNLWGHEGSAAQPAARACSARELRALAEDLQSTLLHLRVTQWGTCAAAVFPEGTIATRLVETFTFSDLDELLSGLFLATADGTQRLSVHSAEAVAPSPHSSRPNSASTLDDVLQQLGHRVWQEVDRWLRRHLPAQAADAAPIPLIVCPGPGLNVLPLHALSVADAPHAQLAHDRYDISYTPSFSLLWNRLRKEPQSADAGERRLLTVADPVGDLPHAAWEARVVASAFDGEVTSLQSASTGDRSQLASVEHVRKWFPRSEVALFATHAEFHSRDPWNRSRLVLSGADAADATGQGQTDQKQTERGVKLVSHGSPQETPGSPHSSTVAPPVPDFLTLNDLFELNLKGNWLTFFSACDSALADVRDPTCEAIGFPGAMLVTGGQTAIGSLWKVDDTATALLSTRFFQELTQLDDSQRRLPRQKSLALWRAQRWLRQLTRCEAERILGQRLEPHLTAEPPFAAPQLWAAFGCYGVP